MEGRVQDPPERAVRRSDPKFVFWMIQTVACIIIVAAALVIKYLGGGFFSELSELYKITLADRTVISEVTEENYGATQSMPENNTSENTQSKAEIIPENTEENNQKNTEESDVGVKAATEVSTASAQKNTFIWPLVGTITSPFGYRNDPFTNEYAFHNGLDIAADMGTPIAAVTDGTVVISQGDPTYGNYIVLEHGEGLKTVYAHCSSLSVSVGQKVEKGQTIGLVGQTGRATGPHLHFEIRVNDSLLDPKWILPDKSFV